MEETTGSVRRKALGMLILCRPPWGPSAGPPSVSHSAWYFKGSLGFSLVGFDTPWSGTLDALLRACDCVRLLYRTRLVVKFHEGTVESASLIDTSRFSHAVFWSQDVTTGGRCVTYWHVPCGLAGSRLDRSWVANRPQVWSASLEAMKCTRRAISGSTGIFSAVFLEFLFGQLDRC